MQLFSTNFSITGTPTILTIDHATAGSSPDSVQDISTTYSIVTEKNNASIVAFLTTSLPKNMTLYVEFTAPSGAKSNGPIALTNTEQTLVFNIHKGSYDNLQIKYRASSTVEVGEIVNSIQSITYRLIDNG